MRNLLRSLLILRNVKDSQNCVGTKDYHNCLFRVWEDNIRMDLEEIGINAGNWVDSAQDKNYWRALVNAALNLRLVSLL